MKDAKLCPAKLRCIRQHRLKYRFQLTGRTRDDFQHIRRRGLLLTRLLQFAGESGDLILQVSSRCVCGWRFSGFGCQRTPPFAVPALFRTTPFHVALRAVHNVEFYASSHYPAMSALGHLRTNALQKGISALPPIATAKADMCPGACLL